MELCALASGSGGNAVYLGTNGRGLLVDAGLPGRRIAARLEAAGLGRRRIEAVIVTHEHRDHLAGVGVWCRRHKVPAWMTPACREAAEAVLGPEGLRDVEVREFEPGRPFEVAGLEVRAAPGCHDAADPVALRVSDGRWAVGLATDLGFVPHAVRELLRGCNALFLESNHDEDRLLTGPYPWFLKQRIRSRHGHLSNEECARLVGELAHPGLRAVVLGHLSETNNEPRLAYRATRAALERLGAAGDVLLLVARQDRPGRLVSLAPAGP
ncbi:MBL fold metallo-hydrolase [Deferrisoma sp.]